jgi:ABC-type antimicrobial peptide transport system permease subunit
MHDSIIKKIWRDLVERKGRTVLTLLGLAIGLWGVASVAVAWFILGHDLSANFLSTNPPAIAMTIDRNGEFETGNQFDMSTIGTIEGADQLENRPQLLGRMEIGPDRWLPLVLWVVEDFKDMAVARVFAETGALPPPAGSFVIERDGLVLANIYRKQRQSAAVRHGVHQSELLTPTEKFEDGPVNVRLPGGRTVTTILSGSVFDPAQAPSRMEQVFYGYISRETANLWTGADIKERLLVTSAAGFEDEAAVRQTAARLEARLRKMGHQVVETRYPSATEHVHQFQMNSILFLLAGLGGLALLMSVVLVLNLINGILTSQVRQIGILKAIGASARQVSFIYLGAMLLLGLLASLIALPFALRSGYFVSSALAAFLNFEVLTTRLPVSLDIAFVMIGSLFPVLAALSSVRRWSRVPVTDALQHFGTKPVDDGSSKVDRIPLPLTLNVRMGLRNAFRKPQRTILTAATLAVGVLIFMVALNMRSSLIHTADTEESLKRFDVLVTFEEPIPASSVAWMSQFPIVERAETWRVEKAMILDRNNSQRDPLALYLVPTDSDVIQANLLDGAWLGPDRPNGIVINQRLQKKLHHATVGTQATLRVADIPFRTRIVGVMKEFGGPAIYMREADYREQTFAMDERINTGFVSLKDPGEENLSKLVTLLEQHFDMAGIAVRQVKSSKIASRIIRGHLDVIVATLVMVALMLLIVSNLGMASAISTNVVERTRELGILRAIGGRPQAIRSILSSESMAMALLGWLTALVLAQPVSRFLSDYFGTALVEYPFDYQGSGEGIYLSLIITITLAGLATIAPARLASRQSVKEAIAYE